MLPFTMGQRLKRGLSPRKRKVATEYGRRNLLNASHRYAQGCVHLVAVSLAWERFELTRDIPPPRP